MRDNMRKNKIIAALLLSLTLTVTATACGGNVKKDNDSKKTEYTDTSKSLSKKHLHGKELYDSLTTEQLEYLKDRAGYFWSVEGEDEKSDVFQNFVKEMKYEDVNRNLLGTGMELYNPSSGVEVFGLTYQSPQKKSYATMKSTSTEEITCEKALEIRKKEKDMRLDDFMKYKFQIEKYEKDDLYFLNLPIKGYEDSYVRVPFSEKDNGEVHISCGPCIVWSKDCRIDKKSFEYGFSMIYSPVLLEVFITNPKHIFQSTDDKIYVTLEEYSVTDESLYLSLFGAPKNEEKHDTSFEVYEINNGKEKLIKKYIGRKEKCGSKDYPQIQNVFVDLAFDGKKLFPGRYLLKYGNGDKKLLTTEFPFTVH